MVATPADFLLAQRNSVGLAGGCCRYPSVTISTKLSHIDLHSFHVLHIHIKKIPMPPEQHTILGGKGYVYKRPNCSLLQCETYFNRIIPSDERSVVTLKPAAK